MTVTITTHSPAQTQALAERLAKLLRPGDVLAYTGPMGAGKTTFTVGLARGLGSSDWVSSPTFALVQEYRGPVPLCHFDFYRITGVDDLYATGFFDYLDGTRVLAVEWSERIPDALPEGAIHIRFEPLENDCRRITISTPAGDDRLAALPTYRGCPLPRKNRPWRRRGPRQAQARLRRAQACLRARLAHFRFFRGSAQPLSIES